MFRLQAIEESRQGNDTCIDDESLGTMQSEEDHCQLLELVTNKIFITHITSASDFAMVRYKRWELLLVALLQVVIRGRRNASPRFPCQAK